MVILFVVGEQSRAELLSVIMRVLVRVLAPSQTLWLLLSLSSGDQEFSVLVWPQTAFPPQLSICLYRYQVSVAASHGATGEQEASEVVSQKSECWWLWTIRQSWCRQEVIIGPYWHWAVGEMICSEPARSTWWGRAASRTKSSRPTPAGASQPRQGRHLPVIMPSTTSRLGASPGRAGGSQQYYKVRSDQSDTS